jgi:hypothetical protein
MMVYVKQENIELWLATYDPAYARVFRSSSVEPTYAPAGTASGTARGYEYMACNEPGIKEIKRTISFGTSSATCVESACSEASNWQTQCQGMYQAKAGSLEAAGGLVLYDYNPGWEDWAPWKLHTNTYPKSLISLNCPN